MNHLETINSIIHKLKENKFNDWTSSMANARDFSFTSTELLSKVAFELKRMQLEAPHIFKYVAIEALDLFNFCEHIGIIIKYPNDNE